MRLLTLMVLTCLLLSACGHKGPLYLPGKAKPHSKSKLNFDSPPKHGKTKP